MVGGDGSEADASSASVSAAQPRKTVNGRSLGCLCVMVSAVLFFCQVLFLDATLLASFSSSLSRILSLYSPHGCRHQHIRIAFLRYGDLCFSPSASRLRACVFLVPANFAPFRKSLARFLFERRFLFCTILEVLLLRLSGFRV